MRTRPVRATALQTGLDHEFVTTLYGAVADRPAGGLEGGVLHMVHPLLQIGQVPDQLRLVRLLSHQLPYRGKNGARAIGLEFVQLFAQSSLRFPTTFTQAEVGDGAEMLTGMRKVQNANSIMAMVVNELLYPLRPIRHRRYRLCPLHAPTMGFH